MSEPIAYLDGQFLPASRLSVPVTDAGFIQGITVAEQLRTFGGRLFRLDQHLSRLRHSLEIVGIDLGDRFASLGPSAEELAAHNHRRLDPHDDLALSLFVTPGTHSNFSGPEMPSPLVAMHTTPLPFHLWCDKYSRGQRLSVTSVRQVPSNCWPHELKCRSRMHYYLADRLAQRVDAGSRALLLDQEGRITEASTANVVLFREPEGLVSPRDESILPGVSLSSLKAIATGLDMPLLHRDLLVEDVARADEVMLCSTSPCVLPATSFNGKPIGGGIPGPRFRQLLDSWSRAVGLDIQAQALRFRQRQAA